MLQAGESKIPKNEFLLYMHPIEYFHEAMDKGYFPIYKLYQFIGMTYFRMGEYSESVHWFEKVLKVLQPGDFAPATFS